MTTADDRVEIQALPLDHPAVEPLRAGLAAEYERLYGPNDEMTAFDARDFDPPSGAFVVVCLDGRVVAGGGVRRWPTASARSSGCGLRPTSAGRASA